MDEHRLRELTREVEAGRLSRRRFVQTMVGLGLTAPMAAQMLGGTGAAHAQAKGPVFTPTRRGGGGALRTLWWQAPTLLNPHFATGTKDVDASRIFYEPLVAYDPDGNLVPVLAAEIPSVANGLLAKDGTSVTWRLKKGVTWHDGKPFTADDVVFTWEFVIDPATAAVTLGSYREIAKIDKVDSHTIKIGFARPQPFWADAFCGNRGMIIPKHVFEPFKGAKSREAPANLKPVGTGAYRIVDFRPGDVVRAELNPNYHVARWPFFDTLEMKGGGDAASAARAVLQTGEVDYSWNLQVEDDILLRLEQGGKGRVNIWSTGGIEHTMCNFADPWTEVDGERSNPRTSHPFLTDPAVRQALALLVDRSAVHEQIYGRQGQTSANYPQRPVPGALVEHALGVQRRQGQPGPGRGGLEARGRRAARQGRQAPQDGVPDRDQRAPAEDAADRQAGRGQGGHRDRDQDGGGLGVLRLRPRQPRQLPALLLRPADVHRGTDRSPTRSTS